MMDNFKLAKFDKYNFKPDSNPPVGAYNTDKSISYLKYRPPSAVFK